MQAMTIRASKRLRATFYEVAEKGSASCHSERSEESKLFLFGLKSRFLAESTLSAQRKGFFSRDCGIRMTSEEPALPSTPLRDSERSRTVSEANGAQHDISACFSSSCSENRTKSFVISNGPTLSDVPLPCCGVSRSDMTDC